ncbi:bifunctional metallophosphatase/5'-nucleotidase [Mesoterricola silvestris]|uniref:Calcineurin-like phosphoesterase domain-containing protein n=1 Tax=Mesoterricola silvestris TaxID=2927979 RepID=A0AA48GHF9_9BACT|nr:metallophosphoesterase [Mesoterricola silvestris]BDU71292.1 hypothetical protein METEAL_04660 [Mesoterricola silvestris]
MPRNIATLAAGSILTVLLVGCSLSSPEKLAGPAPLAGDAKVVILQTTDVHDHANGIGPMSATSPAPLGSYARVAAYVNSVRAGAASGTSVVLVDSGDWSMGTLYDLTLGSQPLATFFIDTLRYDCVTLGNHEFDYTPLGLATALSLSQSKFGYHTPIVASNTVLNGNKDLAPFMGTAITPTYTKTYPSGLKVGFIGLMGTEAAAAAPASAPVTFTDYSRNYALVQSLVDTLRNTEGCHVVVALSHAGTDSSDITAVKGEDVNLAKNTTGIDVIASGHTHNAFPDAQASFAQKSAVAGKTWTTQIICAGAYTTNVARIDLTYNAASKTTTLVSASNKAMTDASLAALGVNPVRDPAQSVFVAQADSQLNYGLGSLFTTLFGSQAGYVFDSTDLTTGVYKVVGSTPQEMRSNDQNPVRCPNGMGDLAADAVRNVPNGIISAAIAQTMRAKGLTQDQAVLALATAGFNPMFFTAGIVPTGVIRDHLAAGPISLANAYNVLPLGISPDTTQAIPVGYPLMSIYLTTEDLKKVCALQLLSQCNLTPSDYYLNISGLSYALDGPGSYLYFKYATAAAVLSVVQSKAATVAAAGAAYQALATLGSTGDPAALLAAMAGGNPYATAMVALNDPPATLDATQTGTNLQVLGDVAAKGAADAATGGITLNTKIFTMAIGAIGQISAFDAADAMCTGPTTLDLVPATRYRVAGDLYAVMMMGAAKSKFGVDITAYAGNTRMDATTVSAADLAGAMKYRINAAGPVLPVVELKEWMALVQYIGALGGTVPPQYLSTPAFTDFAVGGRWGTAVTVRNQTYPLAPIGAMMTTLAGL